MTFKIFYSSSAEKFLEKLEKQISKRILDKIEKLSENPVPSNSRRILGNKELIFRIRIGDFRVLYNINHQENKIIIININKRAKIYN
jgi:mRNA interferase RelE/StbE